MEKIAQLIQHYQSAPPRLSYGGSEGTGWDGLAYEKYPQEEANNSIGPGAQIVWSGKFQATRIDLPIECYCVINVCLDVRGNSIPTALPLYPEMAGHALDAIIYVDMFGCIRAKAIGGATTYATRNALLGE